MRKVIFLFAVVIITTISDLFAQTVSPPNDSYFTDNQGSGSVFVSLADTNSVSEIQVSIGSQSGQSDIFSNTYTFDQTSGLGGGMTYSRTGSEVFLGTGTLSLPSACFVGVRVKDGSGNWSAWFEYVSN